MRRLAIALGLIATAALLWGATVNGSLSILGTLTASVVNFASSTSTVPHKVGTSLPATCSAGQTFFKSDATAGQNIYACTATNTWTLQGDGGSSGGTDLSAQTRMMWAPWGVPASNSPMTVSPLAKRVYTVAITHPYTATYSNIALRVSTAATASCGGGSDPCGLVFSIWDFDLTTKRCQTETLYGGHSNSSKNIATTGGKYASFSSGSNVSGGICTLPAGTYLLSYGSDSTALAVNGLASSTVVTEIFSAMSSAVSTPAYLGYSPLGALTGDGSTLAFPSSLSGSISAINPNTYTPLPVLIFGK